VEFLPIFSNFFEFFFSFQPNFSCNSREWLFLSLWEDLDSLPLCVFFMASWVEWWNQLVVCWVSCKKSWVGKWNFSQFFPNFPNFFSYFSQSFLNFFLFQLIFFCNSRGICRFCCQTLSSFFQPNFLQLTIPLSNPNFLQLTIPLSNQLTIPLSTYNSIFQPIFLQLTIPLSTYNSTFQPTYNSIFQPNFLQLTIPLSNQLTIPLSNQLTIPLFNLQFHFPTQFSTTYLRKILNSYPNC